MQNIIAKLAEQNGITVDWREQTSGRAWRTSRKVRLHLITKPRYYAIALHELGHILGATGKNRLEKEYRAWLWAVENSPIPFDSEMWLELHASLRSYVVWADARQHRTNGKPVLLPKDHPAWALLARARENF